MMSVDFEKFMRICQLEKVLKLTLLAFFLQSCGTAEIDDRISEREIKPNWLKVEKDFAFRGKDDEFLVHPFFDVANEMTRESEIRYFVLTPENSPVAYNLDLLSGALYKVRNYCQTDDIWEGFSGEIHRPNFIFGGVPRYLDQAGEIQKIIVYSKNPKISQFEYSIQHYHNAKVLGSVLIEKCESFPCASKERWNQTQILVGVNMNDPEFSKVETFSDLKKKVDWNYTKAFLVNSFGSHKVGEKFFPAYRINSELNLIDTRKNFLTRAKSIDMNDMFNKRTACISLYKKMWTELSSIRKQSNGQQESFKKFFSEFYSNDSKQYYECQKLVRPANINNDHERHWVFTFINAFNLLERSGLYYSCYEKGWAYNPKVDSDKYYVDQNKEISKCRARDFEKAFDQAINGMSLLKNQINKFFHYIEYDSQKYGSHQKIYSWIIDDVKKIRCEKDEPNPEYFPQDVVWQPFKEDEANTVH